MMQVMLMQMQMQRESQEQARAQQNQIPNDDVDDGTNETSSYDAA